MSMKDKKVKSAVESDEENEQGACSVSNELRRSSLAVPEPISGALLDDSVDNLSMEVHLGGDSSRHPSEISSISYQNLLDDGEPSSSIISRRGSDDSLDSYPPDFPEAELPPDDMETFEASDLPLSEHFPMGALQGADSREKPRGDRSSYVSDNSSNISRPNVKLKDHSPQEISDSVKMRDKNVSQNENDVDSEEASAKRNSLEIRNNIPVVGEVKDYEKELNIDFSKTPGSKPKMMGLKQSPGLARRVDIEVHGDRDSSSTEREPGKQHETTPAASALPPGKLKPKSSSSKPKENVIEVISPIPKNLNIENEYDYVKYARVQQGNSYVGMRLAYSSSNDSLNIKQGAGSENSSREPSPEKVLQQKILSELGGQDKVNDETLTEIPLNSSDYPEDKKAFTLSPENTECDSVEVESVTSEGENSTPGFPTVEDGLSSSQASDADEGASGHGNDRSPSKMLKSKQKAAVDQDLMREEEDCRPKEMDAQAIMDDLKMKREALDMAIADIKSAIQRSKNMSLESPYSSQQEAEENQPVWVKRENREATEQLQRRQEEMRRVREEIERQQEELTPSQGKPHQEKELAQGEDLVSEQEEPEPKLIVQNTASVMNKKGTENLEEENNISVSESDAVSTEDTPKLEIPTESVIAISLCQIEKGEESLASGDNHSEARGTGNIESGILNQEEAVAKIENEQYFVTENIVESSKSIPISGGIEHIHCDSETQQSKFLHSNSDILNTSDTAAAADIDERSDLNSSASKDESIAMKNSTVEYSPKEQSKPFSISSAISAVSNDIILNLGSPAMKTSVIQNIPVEAEELNPPTSQPDNNVNTDIQEFDHLAVINQHQAGNFTGSSNMSDVAETVSEEVFSKCEGEILDIDGSTPEPHHLQKKPHYGEEDICSGDDSNNDDDDDDEDREEKATDEEREDYHCPVDSEGLAGKIRRDGFPRGYDSDDECEDAEGIRYTRRNKGKKYAPLQKDDSLEMGGAYGGSRRDAAKANGHMFSNNRGAHSGSNGSVVNHVQGPSHHQQSGEHHHIHPSEAPFSSEESSDIDANIKSYTRPPNADSDTDEETDRLLQKQYQERDKHVEIPELNDPAAAARRSEADRRHSKAKEAAIRDPDRPEVLIEGVLFRARYLGSTQLISEGQPSKAMRMMQAQEAVGRIKAPEGENQPSTDVDLFVSTEKIMVLNTDLQEIMMDHSLRTISYIADIGDILVIMARRRLITSPDDVLGRRRRQAKILCHVFESDEAQLIAQSIGQAFQVAYLEFLKANGIEDPGLLKEMDYQDVLNQQEIYGEELNLFANKDFHKEVIVPKSKNEPLGVVIVESGWGSMVPTVVLANMLPTGPAARCGQLNIGDQIISINGISLVGLPLSACQTYIKASRSQTVVKLTVVPCPPVVEVLIKRPDVKYQLGFSVQNGVICSLLRGGIAERGGVRVGHRIIEINNQSVVAVPHEKIVTLLASSVGEIHMKTMPTSIFRLLTGQDVPHYL